MSHDETMPGRFHGRDPALLERSQEALDAGRLEEARDGFRQVVAAGIDSPAVWFNLGLAHKLLHEWPESARCNRRAAELAPTSQEPRWNLGIAATALRDWESARWAWQGLGLDVGDGGEPVADYGPAPVRLNPDTDAEVVWGARIDPCRLRIETVPLPESGHRWHDVVLHDVVPRGERMLGDRALAVFDELVRMDPSPIPTQRLTINAPTEEDRDLLTAALRSAELGVEDWTESVRMLCATCSLAGAHEHRVDGEIVRLWMHRRELGVAGTRDRATSITEAWVAGGSGRTVELLTEAR